jgi:hypothetical protein
MFLRTYNFALTDWGGGDLDRKETAVISHTKSQLDGSGVLTYVLTHSMVQNIIWKADCHSACQKMSCFLYGTRRFITLFTKHCYLTLSWASWIQFAPSIPISLRFILMLSFHLRLGVPCLSYLRASQLKPCKHLSHPTCVLYVPHLVLLDLITLTIFGEKYGLWCSGVRPYKLHILIIITITTIIIIIIILYEVNANFVTYHFVRKWVP